MKTRAALVRDLRRLEAQVARKNPEFMRLGYRDDGGRFVAGGTLEDRLDPNPLARDVRGQLHALYQGGARRNPASSSMGERGAIARTNTLLSDAQNALAGVLNAESRQTHPAFYALGVRVYQHIETARRDMDRTMSKHPRR